ncbi:MAG: glutamine synthetase family protein [Acidimicrobiia bacterium]|nr:glutamine synthetase family protein [Acidimicrobiia bacterium]
MSTLRGLLDLGQLHDLVERGDVDTVVVCFPDMQGRLVGKRVMGGYFCDHVAAEGVECCNYLLALDVDMTPLPGYRFADWDQGYGDVRAVPDLSTLRTVPWLERTALVLCDVVDVDTAEPIEVSPRQVLRRQVERAAAAGLEVMIGSELEFFLFRDSYDDAAATGFRDVHPHSDVIEDYHVLQTTRDEYVIRAIRNGMDAAGIPVEFSKGEAGRGQHEINLRYTGALTMADRHAVYKNGVKEIAALAGRSVTFMAKYTADDVGSSCHIHSSVRDASTGRSLMWSDDDPDHLSPTFRGWLGGITASGRELAWMFAPTVNSYKRYQAESWAPTALAWGVDNRTCGYRLVGRHDGFRLESRIPGADANPYLAFAAIIAGGLHGIEHALEPPEPFRGNAYADDSLPRVPATLGEAIGELERSEVAAKAFGPDVHHHLVNTARQEWLAFNRSVTDWERRRYFEQF